jgi:hypothetical protein
VFWKRKPKQVPNLSFEVFLARMRTMDPADWAFAIFESARLWHPGPIDQASISAGISSDPRLVPVLALFSRPSEETRLLIGAVQSARQQSQIAGALIAFGSAAAEPEKAVQILWLGDSLAQLAAIALAYQRNLPGSAVERALAPFSEAVDVAALMAQPNPPNGSTAQSAT